MNEELRPCRFCGSHDVGLEEQEEYNNRGRYFVCCYDCYATGPLRMNSELALKAWNEGVRDDEHE